MSEDALIRLQNLKELGLGPADLKRAVGSSYQYWKDLLDGNKSFGEKAARKIEESLGMVRGALDIPGYSRSENAVLERKQDSTTVQSAAITEVTLAHALEVLGNWVMTSGDLDRDQVRPLINRMFDEPGRTPEIIARIAATTSGTQGISTTTKKVGNEEMPDFLKRK